MLSDELRGTPPGTVATSMMGKAAAELHILLNCFENPLVIAHIFDVVHSNAPARDFCPVIARWIAGARQ